MNIFKLITIFSLFYTVFLGQVVAGPAHKSDYDKLVNSYLIVEALSRDGNLNAISNKKTMYSFLTEEQKNEANKIISMRINDKTNL